MEVQPELSLWPASSLATFPKSGGGGKSSSESESDSGGGGGGAKKRKHLAGREWEEDASHSHASLELQLITDPLPLDWEQCLDLHSGRMYYLNRKTMRKSWRRPREEEQQQEHGGGALDLELNISITPSSFAGGNKLASAFSSASADDDAARSRVVTGTSVGSTGGAAGAGQHQFMVAVPCANCHLLVMLCKSSPACPNCKFVQPSPAAPLRRLAAVKSLETLSLLH